MKSKFSPETSETYAVTARNRIKRLNERASYDHITVHKILDESMMCHIAYVIDGQPYCTATLFWREGTRLYWHGSSASTMARAQANGLPVCVTVAHFDGLVMARTPLNHSANYRSVMAFGKANIVDNPAEKEAALLAIIERYYPGRNSVLRPVNAQELKATTVLVMEIDEAVAKVRAKGNVDEPEDLETPVWAGVIPLRTVIGKNEPCPHNSSDIHPGGIEFYREGENLDQVISALANGLQKK